MGGDFYEFVPTGPSRVVFTLFDIAGKRDQALDIAAAAQDFLRQKVPALFSPENINENERISQFAIELNRQIMAAAGGVHCSPAFVGSYDEEIGILTYCNAGHTPGLLRDSTGMASLNATGLPLGLFTHSTYEAQVSVLQPGAALLLVSRGLLESKCKDEEFGLERLKEIMQTVELNTAQELCNRVLRAAQQFAGAALEQNDVTAISLLRDAAVTGAAA
jgi:serine phosphatase RsbU (regulator of sigma subunit)